MKKVEVVWIDTLVEEAKIPLSVAKTLSPLECRYYGVVLEETEDKIIVSPAIIENLFKGEKAYEYCWAIPRGCIKKITELK